MTLRLPGAWGGAVLAAAALGGCLALLELGYQVLDPFPTADPAEINHTEYGNLSRWDPALGWSGVPGGRATLVTWNGSVHVAHNAAGFRDEEHGPGAAGRPALVFLGDSFTWGYEVEVDALFVNRLRARLPDFEVFNLAHRGWGTDQQLLAFRRWRSPGPLHRVLLVFSENDVAENNADTAYGKPKPRFEIVDGELVLRGVPVPRLPAWDVPPAPPRLPRAGLWRMARRSHLLADVLLRLEGSRGALDAGPEPFLPGELEVTERLLTALDREVAERGGRLLVVFVPSKREIEAGRGGRGPAYQAALGQLCQELGIEHVDLAPAFRRAWRRTYHRVGMHWNARGHALAAQAIHAALHARGGRRGYPVAREATRDP